MRSRPLPAFATAFTVLLLAGCNPSSVTSSASGSPSGQAAPPVNSSAATNAASQPIPVGAGTCNPGAISPAVTQGNISSTICRKGGYTGGIRPPESVTGKEKELNAKSYGYTGRMGDAEYDHDLSGVAVTTWRV